MKKMNRRLGVMETEWTAPQNIEEELSIRRNNGCMACITYWVGRKNKV